MLPYFRRLVIIHDYKRRHDQWPGTYAPWVWDEIVEWEKGFTRGLPEGRS